MNFKYFLNFAVRGWRRISSTSLDGFIILRISVETGWSAYFLKFKMKTRQFSSQVPGQVKIMNNHQAMASVTEC